MVDEQAFGTQGAPPYGSPSESIRERLLAARRQVGLNLPQEDASIPEPSAGQIWRARWESVATAVILITEPSNRHTQAAVVTFDTELADESAISVPAESGSVGIDFVVWLDDARSVPVAVLDMYLGHIHPPSNSHGSLTADLQALRTEQTPNESDGVLRASVSDDLNALTLASWVPDSVGDIGPLLSGMKASDIAEALNLAAPVALQIKRGQRPLEADQAAALAPILGKDATTLAAATTQLPTVVVELFDSPAVRAQVARLAKLRQVPETILRRQVAYEVSAVAARATGDRTDDAQRELWRQKISQYFQLQLASSEDE